MKKQTFKMLALLFAAAMSLSLSACEINGGPHSYIPPESPQEFGVNYYAKADINIGYEYGIADYGQEITLTLSFYEQENVLVTVYETEFYDVIGEAEFNTNDYNFNEDTGFLEDISFKIKIDKESDGLQTVKVRLSCLCGEENCGRFHQITPNHYYDVQAFFFIADSQGIMFSKPMYAPYEALISEKHDEMINESKKKLYEVRD